MFLTDQAIRERLDEFAFESDDSEHPFDADRQIGPCSVDLRLSRTYWRLRPAWRRGRRSISIGRISLEEIAPRRQWGISQLRDAQQLQIKPRTMVLARTAERFTVPPGYAAMVQGRSSYARLGLSVHPSAGLINPGWSGHFPLPLLNESDATLEIPPLTAICQVLLVPLQDSPEQDYAARGSKYQQDDGGPSYWWRDKVLKELVERHPGTVADNVIEDLEAALSKFPEDLVHALEDYLNQERAGSFTEAAALLSDFASVEKRKAVGSRATTSLAVVGAGAAGSTALLAPNLTSTIAWLAVAMGSGVGAAWWSTTRRKYFTENVLRELQN